MKQKLIVNLEYLSHLMMPMAYLADDDDAYEYYQKLGILTEEHYRKIIKKYIVPVYCIFSEETDKERTKLILRYSLSKEKFAFEYYFEAGLPPFDLICGVHQFFVWIWEELFGEENYLLDNIDAYQAIDKWVDIRYKAPLEFITYELE